MDPAAATAASAAAIAQYSSTTTAPTASSSSSIGQLSVSNGGTLLSPGAVVPYPVHVQRRHAPTLHITIPAEPSNEPSASQTAPAAASVAADAVSQAAQDSEFSRIWQLAAPRSSGLLQLHTQARKGRRWSVEEHAGNTYYAALSSEASGRGADAADVGSAAAEAAGDASAEDDIAEAEALSMPPAADDEQLALSRRLYARHRWRQAGSPPLPEVRITGSSSAADARITGSATSGADAHTQPSAQRAGDRGSSSGASGAHLGSGAPDIGAGVGPLVQGGILASSTSRTTTAAATNADALLITRAPPAAITAARAATAAKSTDASLIEVDDEDNSPSSYVERLAPISSTADSSSVPQVPAPATRAATTVTFSAATSSGQRRSPPLPAATRSGATTYISPPIMVAGGMLTGARAQRASLVLSRAPDRAALQKEFDAGRVPSLSFNLIGVDVTAASHGGDGGGGGGTRLPFPTVSESGATASSHASLSASPAMHETGTPAVYASRRRQGVPARGAGSVQLDDGGDPLSSHGADSADDEHSSAASTASSSDVTTGDESTLAHSSTALRTKHPPAYTPQQHQNSAHIHATAAADAAAPDPVLLAASFDSSDLLEDDAVRKAILLLVSDHRRRIWTEVRKLESKFRDDLDLEIARRWQYWMGVPPELVADISADFVFRKRELRESAMGFLRHSLSVGFCGPQYRELLTRQEAKERAERIRRRVERRKTTSASHERGRRQRKQHQQEGEQVGAQKRITRSARPRRGSSIDIELGAELASESHVSSALRSGAEGVHTATDADAGIELTTVGGGGGTSAQPAETAAGATATTTTTTSTTSATGGGLFSFAAASTAMAAAPAGLQSVPFFFENVVGPALRSLPSTAAELGRGALDKGRIAAERGKDVLMDVLPAMSAALEGGLGLRSHDNEEEDDSPIQEERDLEGGAVAAGAAGATSSSTLHDGTTRGAHSSTTTSSSSYQVRLAHEYGGVLGGGDARRIAADIRSAASRSAGSANPYRDGASSGSRGTGGNAAASGSSGGGGGAPTPSTVDAMAERNAMEWVTTAFGVSLMPRHLEMVNSSVGEGTASLEGAGASIPKSTMQSLAREESI